MTTSLLRCAFALKHEVNGLIKGFDDQYSFVEKTGVGVQCFRDSKTIQAVTGYWTLWDGNVAGVLRDWSALVLRIRGSGTLHLKWTKDSVVSESNLATDGAHIQSWFESMSCLVPMAKDNFRIYLNDGTTLGRISKLEVKTTETIPVTLDYAIME